MNVELLSITPNPEELIEQAARTCYQSGDKSVPGNAGKFLAKLLASGHESPFEHASATFRITGCSRAMTHQLVRHRLMSVSQKSQRYVAEKNFDYVIPPSIPPELEDDFRADMRIIADMYDKWKKRGIKSEDARFVLPNACATDIMITANFREFRHIFKLRCESHAQWEIQEIALMMLKDLHARAPSVFQDLADIYLA